MEASNDEPREHRDVQRMPLAADAKSLNGGSNDVLKVASGMNREHSASPQEDTLGDLG